MIHTQQVKRILKHGPLAMKRTYRVMVAIGIAWGVVMAGLAHATLVDLELFNSNPVYDNDQTTPLKGNTSSGDLVELILTPLDKCQADGILSRILKRCSLKTIYRVPRRIMTGFRL
jgi:hypothetical protein